MNCRRIYCTSSAQHTTPQPMSRRRQDTTVLRQTASPGRVMLLLFLSIFSYTFYSYVHLIDFLFSNLLIFVRHGGLRACDYIRTVPAGTRGHSVRVGVMPCVCDHLLVLCLLILRRGCRHPPGDWSAPRVRPGGVFSSLWRSTGRFLFFGRPGTLSKNHVFSTSPIINTNEE